MIVGDYPENENALMLGPTRVTYNLSNELAKLPQTDVTLFKAHRHRHFYKRTVCLQKQPLVVMKVSRQNLIINLLKQKNDLINISGVSSFNVLPLVVKKLLKGKLVYLAHDLVSREKHLGYKYPPQMNLYEKLLLKKSDHIIVASQYMKETVMQDYGVEPQKITVIHLGVDENFFKKSDPNLFMNAFNLSNKHLLLFVGAIKYVKGLDFLLNALRTVNEECTLVLAGPKTPLLYALEREFHDLFSAKRVKYVGTLGKEMLLSAYASAEIFVLPSRHEGFGLVALEAMAAGKAIIISDRVRVSEIIKDGKDGFIVTFGDIETLTLRIEELLAGDKKRIKMGEYAKEKAKEYTWNRIAEKYLRVYKEIIEE